MFEPKQLSSEGVPGALAMAERYRLLNLAWEAESIYLDVLEADPENQQALVGLLLAIADQFEKGVSGSVSRARDLLPRIRDKYQQAYYGGIICERRAKFLLQEARPGAPAMAYELLREAKAWYERAEGLRPPGNDEVLLRWNACARLMQRHPHLVTVPEERYEPYQD